MADINGWIFSIKRYALHDGPGIRTTVFFQGCPLTCPWCHNPESRPFPGGAPLPEGAEKISLTDLMRRLEKDRLFYDQSGGGITVSGGEPLGQPEFLKALLNACRERDLHSAVDTCGYANPHRALPILQTANLILFDLKLLDPVMHRDTCGVDPRSIQANLDGLLKAGSRVRIRFPLIPTYTDTRENLEALYRLISRYARKIEGISVLPYHPAAAHKYLRLGIANPLEGQAALLEEKAAFVVTRLKAIHPEVKIGG